MLTKIDTDRIHIPPDAHGRSRNGCNFREDSFEFPPYLADSERIKAILSFVTNKYLYYLLWAPPECKDGIMHKCLHTNDVVKAMVRIHEDQPGYTLEDAICIALSHDVFRPIQGATHNKFSDRKTQIEHGDEGAELVRRTFPSETLLYQAVKDHNKLTPQFTGPWIDEIRDADRFAIYTRIFDRIGADSYDEGEGDGISPQALEAFCSGKLVDRAYVHTKADNWLCSLGWIWDLKMQKARISIAEEGFPERIVLYMIANFGLQPLEAVALTDSVTNWYKAHNLDTIVGLPEFISIPANTIPPAKRSPLFTQSTSAPRSQ
jgi:hypothetical protein